MARVDVPVIQTDRAGLDIASGASDEVTGDTVNDHKMKNDGNTFLRVRNNNGAGAHNVTLVTTGTVDGEAIPDKTISVPASGMVVFGHMPESIYNDPSTDKGHAVIEVDSTNLRLLAFK